jgi:hypothetical protein
MSRYRRLLTNALTDYRWTLYYLQRLDYHPVHREAIGSTIAMLLPKSPPGNRAAAAIPKTAEQLRNNGFAPIDGLVTPQQLNDIKAYLSTKVCYDPYHPELCGFKDPSDAHAFSVHAYYRSDDLVALPLFLELANHPTILGSLETIFRAKPTITKIQAWWLLHGFDAQANPDVIYLTRPGEFHRDADDWMQFKLYVYLTDVDETAGPHACVKGSHRWMLPSGERSLQLHAPSYPTVENLQLFTGKAGFAWLENSYCLHRAIVAQSKHRLILTISYGLVRSPLWCGNATVPFDSSRFDPYINRVFMHRSG